MHEDRSKRASIALLALMMSLVSGCISDTLRTTKFPGGGNDASQPPVRGIPYYLPKALIPVTITGSRKPPTPAPAPSTATNVNNVTVTVNGEPAKKPDDTSAKYSLTVSVGEPRIVADPDALYFLEYRPALGSDDSFKLRVDANGLLQSGEVTTKDRSGDAALKVVELAGQIAKLAAGPGVSWLTFEPGRARGKAEECTLGEFTTQLLLDPAVGTLPESPSNVRVTIARDAVKEGPSALETPALRREQHRGLLFRAPTPWSLKVVVPENRPCGIPHRETQISVMLPDSTRPFRVDTSRAALVEKKLHLVVQNGMLVGTDVGKPSELLAAMSLPVDVAKALVSIPGELLTFKIERAESRNSLRGKEVDALSHEIDLLKKQRELEAESAARP